MKHNFGYDEQTITNDMFRAILERDFPDICATVNQTKDDLIDGLTEDEWVAVIRAYYRHSLDKEILETRAQTPDATILDIIQRVKDGVCPYCGSTDVSTGIVKDEYKTVRYTEKCHACNYKSDHKFVGIKQNVRGINGDYNG